MGLKASVLAADRQEKVEEIGRRILDTFTSEYISEYTSQLVQKNRDAIEEQDGLLAGSSNKLPKKPDRREDAVNIHEGWVCIEHLKLQSL
eukprot:SAG31_NODE_1326_length_8761_cov_3.896791_3_plen_90_part_00